MTEAALLSPAIIHYEPVRGSDSIVKKDQVRSQSRSSRIEVKNAELMPRLRFTCAILGLSTSTVLRM